MTKATFKLETSTAHATKQVNSFISRSGSLKADLPIMLATLTLVAVRHSNVSDATDLVVNMKDTKMFRANKVIEWLEENGPFTYDKGEKKFTLNKPKRKEMAAAFKDLKDDVELKAFGNKLVAAFDLGQEQDYKGFSFRKRLKMLMSEAEKVANDDDKMAHEGTDMRGFNELKTFLATNTAEDVTKKAQTDAGRSNGSDDPSKQIETTVEAA